MRVRRGSSRIVLLIGGVAIKIPRISFLLRTVTEIMVLVRKRRWRSIPIQCRWGWHGFCRGIKQNVSESRCWNSCRAAFLVPTYLSFGVVNIQKMEDGEQPTCEEMSELVRKVVEVTENQVLAVDPHCFEPTNFFKNEQGFKIVDYGNSNESPLRFTDFIARWQHELVNVLSAPMPPA